MKKIGSNCTTILSKDIWGSHSGCPFVGLEVERLKTVAVEKARENFEKAKEKGKKLLNSCCEDFSDFADL